MHDIQSCQVCVGQLNIGIGILPLWLLSRIALPSLSSITSMWQKLKVNIRNPLWRHLIITGSKPRGRSWSNKTAGYTTFAARISWDSVGMTHLFSHSIKNTASRALSEIEILAWWWKLSNIVSGLKVYSLDSVVYELITTKILSLISSSVLAARGETGPVLFPNVEISNLPMTSAWSPQPSIQ